MSDDEYVTENLSQCESQLNKSIIQISTRIKSLDLNFNSLKNDLFLLTKQYETNRQIESKSNVNELSQKEYTDKLKEIMSSERESNIIMINEALSKYLNEDSIKLSANDIVTHDVVNIIQSDIDTSISQLHSKLKSIIENRQITLSTMYDEMTNEIERINKLVSFLNLFLYWKQLYRVS